ncbi:hypothetical protein [Muricoccus roseus]|uniref:hypothetical protein n=1 Tax=Muricoccus roseus TaxID=198092 RepID=UPI001114CE7C|nr:hypothetical protein [Roseomonas rosea]
MQADDKGPWLRLSIASCREFPYDSVIAAFLGVGPKVSRGWKIFHAALQKTCGPGFVAIATTSMLQRSNAMVTIMACLIGLPGDAPHGQ